MAVKNDNMDNMKKYICSLFAAAFVLLLSGCSKDDTPVVDEGVVGEWHLTSWTGTAPAEDFDVYIEFRADGGFDLYQKVETSVFVKYSGSFTAENGSISGSYSDGEPWGTGYAYEVSADGKTLTMTAGADEVSVYSKTDIPEEVRAASDALTKASSYGAERFL